MLLKKIYSFLISMKLMVVLVLIFATASGVATFIENDYGANASQALVYSAKWFEILQILLGISILGNIFKYKMFQKKKIPVLMFHVAFLAILVGSGITRYYGYEGVMHIREGAAENRMLSAEAFLQIKAKKGEKRYYKEDVILMSKLGGREFSHSLDIDGESLKVSFKNYIDKAVQTAVADPNGSPIVVFVIPTEQGPEKYFLKSGENLDLGPIAFYFDTPVKATNKPVIELFSNKDDIEFSSNIPIDWLKMIDQTRGHYAANTRYKFDARKMFTINGLNLVSKAVFKKGITKVIDQKEYAKTMKRKLNIADISALIVDVSYKGVHREAALMGNGKRYKGFAEKLKIAGLDVELEWGSKIITLPFSLRLRDFLLVKYPGSMSPSSFESHVTLIDKKNLVQREYKIYMNHILDYGGFLFFQSSYDKDEKGTVLSVNHDPGKWPTYFGYTLLFLGLLLNLLNPHSHFGKLSRTKYVHKLGALAITTFVSISFMSTSAHAQENLGSVSVEHAKHFGTLLVQGSGGRIKPLDTYNIELLNKIARTDEMFGLNHNQIILGMASDPTRWKKVDMISVSHPKIKKMLGIDAKQKLFSFEDAFNQKGEYIFGALAEESLRKRASQRDMFDKEIIKVDERLNVAYMIYSGRFMKIFPLAGDTSNTWYFPEEALKNFPPEASKQVLALLQKNSLGLAQGRENGDWSLANAAIDDIKAYQKKLSPQLVLDDTMLKAEILYNDWRIFDRLFPIYLISGFILLILIFVHITRPTLKIKTATRIILVIMVLAFVAHTASLGLRWYIAGHAPWSNGYEAMLYISWTIILSGILFARSSELAMATTGIFAGITLFVAHLSWLDPQITNMVPVLKSYWLTIHVSVITASYGFLGLSTLLGFVSLIFYMMLNNKKRQHRISVNILEATRISEMSMIVGLSLLTIGNFLGGIWANESWGRYWGWDPKETWALVTILVYVFVVHMRFIPILRSNFIFNALSVVAYSSVIMTYFGVNYYLSGMHSYAAGDPIPVPVWIYYAISVIIITIVIASFNRDKLVKVDKIYEGLK